MEFEKTVHLLEPTSLVVPWLEISSLVSSLDPKTLVELLLGSRLAVYLLEPP